LNLGGGQGKKTGYYIGHEFLDTYFHGETRKMRPDGRGGEERPVIRRQGRTWPVETGANV